MPGVYLFPLCTQESCSRWTKVTVMMSLEPDLEAHRPKVGKKKCRVFSAHNFLFSQDP
jgi:hypothetical protein